MPEGGKCAWAGEPLGGGVWACHAAVGGGASGCTTWQGQDATVSLKVHNHEYYPSIAYWLPSLASHSARHYLWLGHRFLAALTPLQRQHVKQHVASALPGGSCNRCTGQAQRPTCFSVSS